MIFEDYLTYNITLGILIVICLMLAYTNFKQWQQIKVLTRWNSLANVRETAQKKISKARLESARAIQLLEKDLTTQIKLRERVERKLRMCRVVINEFDLGQVVKAKEELEEK